jgi:hypothetical protein
MRSLLTYASVALLALILITEKKKIIIFSFVLVRNTNASILIQTVQTFRWLKLLFGNFMMIKKAIRRKTINICSF